MVIQGYREHYSVTRTIVHYLSISQGIDTEEADIIERGTAEACHNALYHDSDDEPNFRLELLFNQDAVIAIIENRGEPFEFETIEPFNIQQDFLKYKDGGLGIPIMKAIMDEVHYERKSDNINKVTLVKYINKLKGEG